MATADRIDLLGCNAVSEFPFQGIESRRSVPFELLVESADAPCPLLLVGISSGSSVYSGTGASGRVRTVGREEVLMCAAGGVMESLRPRMGRLRTERQRCCPGARPSRQPHQTRWPGIPRQPSGSDPLPSSVPNGPATLITVRMNTAARHQVGTQPFPTFNSEPKRSIRARTVALTVSAQRGTGWLVSKLAFSSRPSFALLPGGAARRSPLAVDEGGDVDERSARCPPS